MKHLRPSEYSVICHLQPYHNLHESLQENLSNRKICMLLYQADEEKKMDSSFKILRARSDRRAPVGLILRPKSTSA
ncbi:hypothetical protein HNY73_013463 [Argiope bruennichi]|nr:hypothetical protein HNY73_013463 [Argiope bruennichi]